MASQPPTSPSSSATHAAPAVSAASAALDRSVLTSTRLDPYYLHEHDPDVQNLYAVWHATHPTPPIYAPGRVVGTTVGAVALARDPWTTKAAAAWVLATQLGDHAFERYALAQLIQTCAAALFGPWAFIEARCPLQSSIRRFANHWVAWNTSLAGTTSGRSEFAGLYATTLVNKVVREETHDPRTFDLDHWYSGCGDDLSAKCDHDPAVRQAKAREKKLSEKPKAPQWGSSGEKRRQKTVMQAAGKLRGWRITSCVRLASGGFPLWAYMYATLTRSASRFSWS